MIGMFSFPRILFGHKTDKHTTNKFNDWGVHEYIIIITDEEMYF